MSDPTGLWTRQTLRALARRQLAGTPLVVVSHREPYTHEVQAGEVRWRQPVSGPVSALDPVLRATGGIWIAHGSGSADRKTVDPEGRVPVPPDDPQYTLRRVWLSEEEERGYDHGFSNQTLWPLCHIAYVCPTFRPEDWKQYAAVNERFARAVLEEAPRGAVVWIQDFHLALLPALLRRLRPDLRLAHFWHIPWPGPDIFRICPWRRELLAGLLGNDLLGFHTRQHCDAFLETVACELEAAVDRRASAVSHRGRTTLVRPFPISVDAAEVEAQASSDAVAREMIRLGEQHGLVRERILLGLDRFDYTKGIPERLQAVDRLLSLSPEWAGRFVFVQGGMPSRPASPAHRSLWRRVARLGRQINRRHGTTTWAPVALLEEECSATRVLALYRLADCLMVTALHDGMNLVAKEYVAARADGDGVLVLSEFTGAARELPEAVLVNPFDVDGTAAELAVALGMEEGERRARMARMRARVHEWNIYRWAGEMLEALAGAARRGEQPERAAGEAP